MQKQTMLSAWKLFNRLALHDHGINKVRKHHASLKSLGLRYFTCSSIVQYPRGSRVSNERQEQKVKESLVTDTDNSNGVFESTPPVLAVGGNKRNIKELLNESLTPETTHIKAEYPSDVELVEEFHNHNVWARDQMRHAYVPKAVPPEDTSVIFFPGQGSQFVGMAKRLLQYPNVKEMFEIANETLRYDLLDICLNGPKAELDKTLNCQPAIFVTSLAAIEALREDNPKAIEHCIGCAGFSVGEYAALVFAGSLTFEDGLEVVKVRARAMQQASEDIASGMMTVFLGPKHKCNFACHTAKQFCLKKLNIENPVCEVANFLYPECKVIAGHIQALEFLEQHGKEFGIKRTKRLPVSGAFHTKLMKSACGPLRETLKDFRMKRPLVPVYSNVTARPMTLQGQIKRLLVEQVKYPVKWEQIMQTICARPQGQAFPQFYEVGPGKQIGSLLKMTNNKAHHQYKAISV